MSSNQQIFRIDKFLGLNEQDESQTELRLGEAAKMVNWRITDGANITTRAGFAKVQENLTTYLRSVSEIIALWTGYIENRQWLVIAGNVQGDPQTTHGKVWLCEVNEDGSLTVRTSGDYPSFSKESTKVFYYDHHVFVCYGDVGIETFAPDETGVLTWQNSPYTYIPLAITGGSPAGGGTTLESLNLLSDVFMADYSSDGNATKYLLPSAATGVRQIVVNNIRYGISEMGSLSDTVPLEFTFIAPPPQGVNNVRFYCEYDRSQFLEQRKAFNRLIYCEPYNGATDNRLFFYGDGTNKTYYTGFPSEGSGLYLPAMNELDIPFTDAPITGMVRDYSKLMVFTKDGTANISYSPVTLENGDVIAGFYVGTTSKEIGNEAPNQVQVVNNYPRTLFRGDLYEWHVSSATYADERYSKRISDRIQRTLRSADLSRAVTCDDNNANTYYIFLNDEQGTVLVNHYGLDLWTMYRSSLAVNVVSAFILNNRLHFAAGRDIYYLTDNAAYDVDRSGNQIPINAVWESGYMHFGADNLRKYSSDIWVSMLPQESSLLSVTASTDRRTDYTVKQLVSGILNWSNVDFSHFSFIMSKVPRLKRIKIKVKKFVYYKLIFRVEDPGSRATILSVDQAVRFAGKVK